MKKSTLLLTCLGISGFFLTVQSAQAQLIVPAADGLGTQVTSPDAQRFNISGGTQAGGNLFHSFQQFGLSSGQVANFIAPTDVQNILSRVVGGNASVIDGQIQVSGGAANLYLLNPAGILFGANASLNVPASFTATTANGIQVGNQWFGINTPPDLVSTLNGAVNGLGFATTEPGAIVNAGHLAVSPGQQINLVGGVVINTGTITAPGGQVTIAAVPGEKLVRISQSGSVLSLDLPIADQSTLLASAHPFTPLSLPQLLTGGGMTGTGLSLENGAVYLTNQGVEVPTQPGTAIASGQVSVASTQPGFLPQVSVLGDRVGLFGAAIEASAIGGGGTVLIGGDYQGQGTVPNAQRTAISADSLIRADALQTGEGGRVIVWSDQVTAFAGTISAKAGQQSGNGGFVEVSGKETLAFTGQVDVSSSTGQAGTILLDPRDVTIDNAGADDAQFGAGSVINASTLPAQDFQLSKATIEALTGNVTIAATRNITIANGVSLFANGGATRLQLLAGGNFSMDPSQTLRNSNGMLEIQAGGTITAGNLNGSTILLVQGTSITARSIQGSQISLTANGGDIRITNQNPFNGQNTQSMNLIARQGTVEVSDLLSVGNTGQPFDGVLTVEAASFRVKTTVDTAAETGFAANIPMSIWAFPANQPDGGSIPGKIEIRFAGDPNPKVLGSGTTLVKINLLRDTEFTIGKPLGTTGSGTSGYIGIGRANIPPGVFVLLSDGVFSASIPPAETAAPVATTPTVPDAAQTAARDQSLPGSARREVSCKPPGDGKQETILKVALTDAPAATRSGSNNSDTQVCR